MEIMLVLVFWQRKGRFSCVWKPVFIECALFLLITFGVSVSIQAQIEWAFVCVCVFTLVVQKLPLTFYTIFESINYLLTQISYKIKKYRNEWQWMVETLLRIRIHCVKWHLPSKRVLVLLLYFCYLSFTSIISMNY